MPFYYCFYAQRHPNLEIMFLTTARRLEAGLYVTFFRCTMIVVHLWVEIWYFCLELAHICFGKSWMNSLIVFFHLSNSQLSIIQNCYTFDPLRVMYFMILSHKKKSYSRESSSSSTSPIRPSIHEKTSNQEKQQGKLIHHQARHAS